MASLASSEGWKARPMLTQRRAPFMIRPNNLT